MTFKELLTGSLVAGIGTLLSGLAALIAAMMGKSDRGTANRKGERPRKSIAYVAGMALVGASALLLGLTLTGRSTHADNDPPLPLNAQLTKAAWDAYAKGLYEMAITNADKCIDEFGGQAERQQEALTAAKATPPTMGAPSETEKAATMSRGLLNDVATCYYIKGRAAESVGRQQIAKQAYSSAMKLSYGRCWDPGGGFFWSPAEAASDRLKRLP
jgi:hypothetical protein